MSDGGTEAAGTPSEDETLLREAEKIAQAVGRMFPGLCEVVLHDLRDPGHAVRAIENNLSGRRGGEPATELGLARIADPDYPGVVQNYPGRLPDGRPVKSTSIGIRNSRGVYVGALCLNLDTAPLTSLADGIARLVRTDEHESPPVETLRARTVDTLREAVRAYAAERGRGPRELRPAERRELLRALQDQGHLEVRHAVRVLTALLGVSRATVYNHLRPQGHDPGAP
ncbi:helix-turn-helix transcriptional regulator [Streptomyces clavuligerus]|uniref:YheO domain protein n=1 Tax=Streptomyces clavuligerus TaxID=1901 RepID=E2Q820_STRCL|nr:PAS domain-containing protein [Streptomyces clavuligerus]ANW17894.1 DNA-binding protein [Streptomyces clavuligerus]AXU12448.1 transcriptional regulator [Streptomyces clavuligerus]EFG09552.1 YheO domain protein [Streptomyces clavuligerus]MBY6302339.1 PAS domain-containing protein [Streptomyces clavuligerus]QCS05230.1 DNA-binding protein [Streptomyces clavuligerus]